MNKENLQKQIEEMKTKLADMEAELNKPEVIINYWQPNKLDRYFYIHPTNQVHTALNHYAEDTKYRVFKTRKEAEKYAEYVKAEETLRRIIAEANEGWLPDWKSVDAIKVEVQLNAHYNIIFAERCASTKRQPNFMYIKSKELAVKLMKKYEVEFKTYLSY
mgnify:FL=1